MSKWHIRGLTDTFMYFIQIVRKSNYVCFYTYRKGRGTREQIANIRWIIEKARKFQKNNYFCFIDYAKAFDYVDHNKLWKILKEMEYQTT